MTKIFELNKNLFKVGDNHVCVEENPRVGDWVLEFQPNDAVGEIYYVRSEYVLAKDIQKKIVFSTQFIHESIPLLNLESEEDEVFKMASENILTSSRFVNTENEMDIAYSFFHNGYQKAKETFKYTEEDLRKAFEAGNKRGWSGYPNTDNWTQPKFEEFIQSLQQPKEIKSIEVEYFPNLICTSVFSHLNLTSVPAINPNGKIKCKINY